MNPLEQQPPDKLPPTVSASVLGARWALALGTTLVVVLAAFTIVRWVGKPASAVEEIKQIPIVAATPKPLPDVLAPDPGDTP